MMKLQLSVITILFLCAMTSISSTSKDHAVVGNKNTQNNEVLLDLNPNQSQYEQRYQDQQGVFKKKNQTSKFTGVSWNNDKKKWQAQLSHNKKKYHGGNFANEECAAMNINLLCDKLEMERKNPTIDITPNTIQPKNQTSKFTGVYWNNGSKNWQTQLSHNKKNYYGGLFDNEEQAAMKVNLLCDKYEKERKHPTIDIKPNAMQQKLKNKTSIYAGVYWKIDKKKWQTQLKHNKKKYYSGHFDNEECAAMNVNLLCDKLGIERKNPRIDITTNTIQQKNKTSIFNGVSWNRSTKKWKAQLKHKGKEYHGGYSDNEEHAAMKVNLLCDKLEIERKHPTINIKPNAIQEETNPIMYQPNLKNIVDEDIKVEHESILDEFKDGCENSFMKRNEDGFSQHHANTKQKRKQNSIVNDHAMKEKLKITTSTNGEIKLFKTMRKD